MDSLTQIALGAAVGTAVLGRRIGVRATAWGAICGTLPDLDVLIPYGDPVRDFTFHRAESHSLFWLSLASPLVAGLAARVRRVADRTAGVDFRDWWLLCWLALVTHPLLDAFTVYGTQLLLPFSDYPVGFGSVFIIDPLYTLPLAAGVIAALRLRRRDPRRAARWNHAGLAVSAAYLAWSAVAQAHVTGRLNHALGATPLASGRMLVTPTPFNTLLWRVVVMDDDAYHEGHVSLLDDARTPPRLARHPNPTSLLDGVRDDWTVRRLAWFSKGFYRVHEQDRGDSRVVHMADLRMGQTPWFVFSFAVAERSPTGITVVTPAEQMPTERPPSSALRWLWQRIWDASARPPSAAIDR